MSYTIKYDADGNDEPGTIETLASDGTTIIDTFLPAHCEAPRRINMAQWRDRPGAPLFNQEDQCLLSTTKTQR